MCVEIVELDGVSGNFVHVALLLVRHGDIIVLQERGLTMISSKEAPLDVCECVPLELKVSARPIGIGGRGWNASSSLWRLGIATRLVSVVPKP